MRRGSRQRLAWLAGLACVLALCGLTPAAQAEETEIMVWGLPRQRGLDAVLRRFEEEHPGLVVVRAAAGSGQTPQQLLTAVAGGSPPELILQDRFAVAEWASRGAFQPLDEAIAAGLRAEQTWFEADVLPELKRRFDRDPSEMILVFESESGRQVDFDLRGSLDEILERDAPLPGEPATRGPGRPRLGVVSREVSLLPHHWDYLEAQPTGASAALRRLVELAIKTQPGKERARRARAALAKFLSAMAGDRPHYEDATRALFRGETDAFEAAIRKWPKDIREHASAHARAAAAADAEGG